LAIKKIKMESTLVTIKSQEITIQRMSKGYLTYSRRNAERKLLLINPEQKLLLLLLYSSPKNSKTLISLDIP